MLGDNFGKWIIAMATVFFAPLCIAAEPSIAVTPVDRTKIAIGWRQFNTITSNFRQAGRGYSTDGGRTWTFPGVLEPGVFRSDPVLAVASP